MLERSCLNIVILVDVLMTLVREMDCEAVKKNEKQVIKPLINS